ncbi:MAG: Ig-like domain-containing protein [Candidatus Moraniibacteriota bacterium]|nr:MAG: Ig-like domain-containing protein [Candidatus Moranbacteria bacterium]
MSKTYLGFKSKRIFLFSVFLALCTISLFVYQMSGKLFQGWFMKEESANNLSLENKIETITIIPQEKTILNSDYFFMELKLGDVHKEEEATWKSSDTTIANVSNTPGTKGQVTTGGKAGSVIITAEYEGKIYTSKLQVENAGLEVSCFPRKNPIKVGEKVEWVLLYKEIGVPNYTYEWTGDITSNIALPETSFDTPGIKNVHAKTEDVVGNMAEAQCDPLKVIQ